MSRRTLWRNYGDHRNGIWSLRTRSAYDQDVALAILRMIFLFSSTSSHSWFQPFLVIQIITSRVIGPSYGRFKMILISWCDLDLPLSIFTDTTTIATLSWRLSSLLISSSDKEGLSWTPRWWRLAEVHGTLLLLTFIRHYSSKKSHFLKRDLMNSAFLTSGNTTTNF